MRATARRPWRRSRRARGRIARSPGPKGQQVTDTFSLKGFSRGLRSDRQGMPAAERIMVGPVAPSPSALPRLARVTSRGQASPATRER